MNVRAMAENDDKQSAAVEATESLAGASEGVEVRSPRKYMRDFEQAVDLEGYNNEGHEAVQEVIGAYDRALEGAEAPKSKEQKEKERRRDALRGMISSIGDASRAVANLIFTNRYAPNMYNGNALGDAHKDDVAARRLIDKEAEDKWMSLVLGRGRARERLAEIDNRRAELAARRKAEREAKAKADEDVKRQRAYEDKKRPIELRSAEADAIIKEQDAKDRAKLNSAEACRRMRVGSGGSGRPARHAWLDKDGVTIHNEPSEAAARSQAAVHGGTYLTTPTRTSRTVTDEFGESKTTHEVRDASTPSPKKAVMASNVAGDKSNTTKKKDVTD